MMSPASKLRQYQRAVDRLAAQSCLVYDAEEVVDDGDEVEGKSSL